MHMKLLHSHHVADVALIVGPQHPRLVYTAKTASIFRIADDLIFAVIQHVPVFRMSGRDRMKEVKERK